MAAEGGTPHRVVQLVNTLATSDGGPARYAWDLACALADAGTPTLTVTVQGADGPSVVRADAAPALATVEVAPAGGWRARVRALLPTETSVLIVHGYYLPWIPLAVVTALRKGIPVLLAPHGSLNAYEQRRSRLKKRVWAMGVGWWLDGLVSTFLVTSEHEAAQVSNARRKVSVVGAGVATAPVPGRPANGHLSLLTLSRVAPKKRIDLAVRAVDELRSRGHDARLVVAGSGPVELLTDLAELVRQLDLGEHVTFIGDVEGADREAAYAAADVYLAPSDDENFGLAIAEALVRGVPTVASQAVDCVALVESPIAVVLEEPSPTAIADAVESLVARPTIESDSRALAAGAAAAFDWAAVAERVLTLASGARTPSR